MTLYLVTSEGGYYVHGLFSDYDLAQNVAEIFRGRVREMHIGQLYDTENIKFMEQIKLMELGLAI